MTEYIDRKKFDEYMTMQVYLADDEDYTQGLVKAMKMVREAEEHSIAADVQGVKHGRWIWVQGVCEDDYEKRCSRCRCLCCDEYDEEDETTRYYETEYCPNCGAKMDLKERG